MGDSIFTRRRFVGGGAAAVALAACGGCAGLLDGVSGCVDDMRAKARIGVLANLEIGWKKSAARFAKALAHFKECGVDAVVLIGRLAKTGAKGQYDTLDEIWNDVFPSSAPSRLLVAGEGDAVGIAPRETEATIGGFRFRASGAMPPGGVADVTTFHGQGKSPLTDELCVYPRDGRCIFAGSMSGVVPQPGYAPFPSGVKGRLAASAQGLLVTVFGSSAAVARLDFSYAAPPKSPYAQKRGGARPKKGAAYVEKVAEDWILGPDGAVVSPEPPAPEFWADTSLAVARGNTGLRPVYTLRWPPVLAKHTGARAFFYEVEVRRAGVAASAPLMRKSVLSNAFHASEDREGAVSLDFGRGDISGAEDGARLVASVTPISSTGARGKPIEREFLA